MVHFPLLFIVFMQFIFAHQKKRDDRNDEGDRVSKETKCDADVRDQGAGNHRTKRAREIRARRAECYGVF